MNHASLPKFALVLLIAGALAAVGLAVTGTDSSIYWLVAAGFAVFGYSIYLRLRRS